MRGDLRGNATRIVCPARHGGEPDIRSDTNHSNWRSQMRTLILVSALVALAACSDSQQTTAPASSRGRAASGDVAPSGQSTVAPNAKPGSTPAFTTVTQVV